MPTTESQLKYVILSHVKSESFHYPDTTTNIYDQIKKEYQEIEKAYDFLGTLNFEKVMSEIANK